MKNNILKFKKKFKDYIYLLDLKYKKLIVLK